MSPTAIGLLMFAAMLVMMAVRVPIAAAMVPGLLAMVGYIVVIGLVCRRHPELAEPMERASWAERGRALLGVWPILAIFIVVFGGIYGGLFSPTEGAAVGAMATLVAGVAQGELNLQAIERGFVGAAETAAMVFMIFLGADMMNSALALTQMPAALAAWMTTLTIPPLAIIGAILLLFIVLGCVMDELSMLLLTIPVLFPAVMGLDLWGLGAEDKAIWFGILVLMVVGFGLVAPPVGLNVYVVNSLAKGVSMNDTYKGVLPFLASDVIRTLLLLFFPAIALGLVKFLV